MPDQEWWVNLVFVKKSFRSPYLLFELHLSKCHFKIGSSVNYSRICNNLIFLLSVSLSGYWIPPATLQLSPDPGLVSLVEAASFPLLYVGFGSMESYLLDVSWEGFFQVLESGETLAVLISSLMLNFKRISHTACV